MQALVDLGGGRSSPVEYVVIDEAPPTELSGDRMEGETLTIFSDFNCSGHSMVVTICFQFQLCVVLMYCYRMKWNTHPSLCYFVTCHDT